MEVPTHASRMELSGYNAGRKFTYDFRESRLRKCASLIASLAPGRLLDIGCTNGEWACHWASRGWQTAGIDISQSNVASARDAGPRLHRRSAAQPCHGHHRSRA